MTGQKIRQPSIRRLLALGQRFHGYALSQVRPSSWVGRPHKYLCRRGQRMRGSAAYSALGRA
jgi:hypothetical protein